jgi:hypothetical protein
MQDHSNLLKEALYLFDDASIPDKITMKKLSLVAFLVTTAGLAVGQERPIQKKIQQNRRIIF